MVIVVARMRDGVNERWPSVSVIMAVLNEREFIDSVLSDLLGQDYEGPYEVIVADGCSTDGTRERLEELSLEAPALTVIDNPEVRQAFGLNRAAAKSTGEILIRADGHTSFASDYVRTSVAALSDMGGAVGGPMRARGKNQFGRAVAAAMDSPLTMGPGRFHHASGREEVDTVYLGAFPADAFAELGGFRSFPSGRSEDADFYFRWRMSGRRVYVDPAIRSVYSPRSNPKSLFHQYWRYGQGKAEMLWANGRLPSWRPLAPVGLILGLFAGLLIWMLSGSVWPLATLFVPWLGLLMWVGWRSDEGTLLVMGVAMTMHLSYGLGFVYGFWRIAISKMPGIPVFSRRRS